MKNRIILLVYIYVGYVLLFVLGKPLFMLLNGATYAGTGFGVVFTAIAAGLRMDFSVAAYLTAIPALILTAGVLLKGAWQRRALDIWRYLSVLIAVSAIAADAVLYSYWNFKLDTTPIFYFLSSPSAALASVSPWFVVGAVTGVLAATAAVGYAFGFFWNKPEIGSPSSGKSKAKGFVVMLLLTAALFIPIRGGFTVATMNPSAAYFSKEARLNHIAVNPLFSLLYSATHSSDFSDSFAYFAPGEAEAILGRHSAGDSCATATPLLKTARPDIYIIILESFSAHLLPSLGGEAVALRLDSLARQGVLFTNFYASSFRTDRAIPAIVSGFPAQPTTSVMKFVDKTEHLPSLARVLADSAGYRTEYYYGGDINFVNQRAFLLSGGYDKVLCDKDFPLSQRLSKWGAHDDVLLRRAWADIAADSSRCPAFRVIQTSSSHEPFEVPYSNPRYTDPRANAFAFADSCVGDFVDSLRASGRWGRSLVVLVPDHWGAYPAGLSSPTDRHHVPLVLTGGALSDSIAPLQPMPADQTAIAATLLAGLNIGTETFPFSRNLLDGSQKHFAFFSEPDFAAAISESDTTVISVHDGSVIAGTDSAALLPKAYLQKLYKYLNDL